jgi:hypothetical protein
MMEINIKQINKCIFNKMMSLSGKKCMQKNSEKTEGIVSALLHRLEEGQQSSLLRYRKEDGCTWRTPVRQP